MLKTDFEKSITITDFIKILQVLDINHEDIHCVVKATAPYTNVECITPLTGIAIHKISVDNAVGDSDIEHKGCNKLVIIFNTEEYD